jgi:hypothetical protein
MRYNKLTRYTTPEAHVEGGKTLCSHHLDFAAILSPATDLHVRLFPAISFRLTSGAFYRPVIEVKYEI